MDTNTLLLIVIVLLSYWRRLLRSEALVLTSAEPGVLSEAAGMLLQNRSTGRRTHGRDQANRNTARDARVRRDKASTRLAPPTASSWTPLAKRRT